ncbi:Ser/Thr protein phosphatase family protein [Aspergillus nomiae NRRL 13137]|uniref:Ser/Thr protein phosphatase family protein n=1 Tax=Aspergillus nomiae NRRL (strain ATCC 15546 / NRRL 13137 / CBS 260.88 / M93) TaxID=1509407 RepID=A0A0L1IVK6_ASPN3|nr:Ser/Thr protein phosphatase family protein [Aspergillus nomiae NRRL 13137]KNG83228.1 Ser/Thr protein phosphatase family protein [Aspergillus nomiae NRRL 13137]
MRRKTRFVCVSDTHGYTPAEAGFKLPAGDVLIHAGDLTNQGSITELRKTIDWVAAADFEVKIVICGNHDITLDPNFYAKHGPKFHNQRLEDPQKCIEVVTASSSIVFLRHQSALVRLTRPNGPNTIFKVFGSPFSQSPGTWAWGYESVDAVALWSRIPLDTDLVVTHTPPRSHCDRRATGGSVGCEALRQALGRVRPSLAICGHVHESRGYERVIRGALPEPGSKKQSLIDLTGKKAQQLENDEFFFDEAKQNQGALFPPTQNILIPPSADDAEDSATSYPRLRPDECPSDPPNDRSRRRETCIVNAAIMATSWPHRGGKQFNPPIVVDLELPVWRE